VLNWTSPSERALRLVRGADDLHVHMQPGLMRRQLLAGPDARHAGPHDTGQPDAGQRDPGQPEDAT
jgi:hypothetical protein